MIFSRINLSLTKYQIFNNARVLKNPCYHTLLNIYVDYCRYKNFESVIPFFIEDYSGENKEIIGYFDQDKLVAFSLILKYPSQNSVTAEQFAWDYQNPRLRLGIKSLQHECEFYKSQGYQYLYLGEHSKYKSDLIGYEILGPV
jgi:hypothetical protein